MNDFKFVSERYSIHNTTDYRLSIQVNPDGFSVLVTGENNTVLKIIHLQTGSIEKTKAVFRTEEDFIKLRELSFKSSSIIINTNRVTLIPDEFRDFDNHADFFKIEFDLPHESSLKTVNIPELNVSAVFEVPSNYADLISGFRNNPRVTHFAKDFLNYLKKKKSTDPQSFSIYTSPGLLHTALTEYGGFKFYNSFACRNEDELLYHLMHVIRKLHLNSKTNFYYSGHLAKDNATWIQLMKFIPEIQLLPNELSFELAWNINENYFSFLLNNTGANNQR